MNKHGLVRGIGLNDADYMVQPEGKACKKYNAWVAMLRNYKTITERGEAYNYKGVKFKSEWLRFSVFTKFRDEFTAKMDLVVASFN